MSELSRAVSAGYGPRYGPFSQYAPESVGVGYTGIGCRCDPTRGQSCRTCADKPSGHVRQAVPPCMIPGFDHVEAERRRAVWFAAQRARLGIPHPTNLEEMARVGREAS